MYIAFEGTVGTGKTTQSKKYTEYLKQKYPDKQIVWTREPGGTEIADDIRKIAQGTKHKEEMEHLCEAYLFAASRAQSLPKVVKPVLDANGISISDRSFISSLAIQAFGREQGLDNILNINMPTVGAYIPDQVIFLDLNIEEGLKRTYDHKGDKFENLGKEFYQRVYKGYIKVSQLPMFKGRWLNIDASGSERNVFNRIVDALKL